MERPGTGKGCGEVSSDPHVDHLRAWCASVSDFLFVIPVMTWYLDGCHWNTCAERTQSLEQRGPEDGVLLTTPPAPRLGI